MVNEERFWDASIAEAVREDTPPDLTARVLKELAESPETVTAAPRRKGRLLKICLELAAAACVVVAIGWATGLIKLPEGNQTIDPEPRQVAAPEGTDYAIVDETLVLRHGWLLVTTGSLDVHCGDSRLTEVDGRVLVFAGSMPTRAEAAAVADWLKANELEIDMITQTKRWAQGLAMAAMVLTGSAVLDGTRIEAEQKEDTTWHIVRSVMDIDKLDESAHYVRGEYLSGAHLEFMAERKQIRAIEARNCEDLRPAHIRSLATLPHLTLLDLRDAAWNPEVVDYGALLALPHLKQLAVDYQPDVTHHEGKFPPADFETSMNITSTLRELANRGVQITLYKLEDLHGAAVRRIAENISTLRELDLNNNDYITDADIKSLAEHPNLESLNLIGCRQVTELGLAYLARNNRLKRLAFTDKLTEAVLHQISRMTNLEVLELPDGTAFSSRDSHELIRAEAATFKALQSLPKLRHLTWWPETKNLVIENFALLAGFKSLRSLNLNLAYDVDMQKLLDVLHVAQLSNVEMIEISCYSLLLDGDSTELLASEAFAKLKKSDKLRELTIGPIDLPRKGKSPIGELLAPFTGLKIVRLSVEDADDIPAAREFGESSLKGYKVEIHVSE
jgi:hypothetical protein